jgi:cytochrome c-type biogenesis protein
MGQQVGLLAAFAGGALSFVAPCVLPLIPGYLSFITGLSASDLKSGERRASEVLIPSLLFVLGFSAVFVLLGLAAGTASQTLGPVIGSYKRVLTVAAGVVVAAFGVLIMDVVRIPWLYRELRADLASSRRFGKAAALVMGAAFGLGWTPCVGPILAVILGMAAQTGDAAKAAVLLAAYSAGLGVPFLLTAALFSRAEGVLKALNRHSLLISRLSGGVLVVMGLLIATDQLGRISALLVRSFPFLGTIG